MGDIPEFIGPDPTIAAGMKLPNRWSWIAGLAAAMLCAGCDPRPPAHGTEWVVQVIEAETSSDDAKLNADVAQSLKRRLDRFGLKQFSVDTTPTNSLVIRVPTLPAPKMKALIQEVKHRGFLEFRLVHAESEKLAEQGELPTGYELLICRRKLPNNSESAEKLIVSKQSENGLSSGAIKSAMVMRGEVGHPEIAFELTPQSAKAFAALTGQNVGRRLAIILDGEVMSAPKIQSAIERGSGIITGDFDAAEAISLANVMELPLPAPVKVIQERSF